MRNSLLPAVAAALFSATTTIATACGAPDARETASVDAAESAVAAASELTPESIQRAEQTRCRTGAAARAERERAEATRRASAQAELEGKAAARSPSEAGSAARDR